MIDPQPLSFTDHNRDVLGLTYVYPVVSRRAAGVSIGVNLNINHACNWACVYCQVPQLTRGRAPDHLDLAQLRQELEVALGQVCDGSFLQDYVPPDLRRLNDIAFSGNGEPTSSPHFLGAVNTVLQVLRARQLLGTVKVVVITNGSFALRPAVHAAFQALGEIAPGTMPANPVAQGLDSSSAGKPGRALGEVWFKVDRARPEQMQRINHVRIPPALVLKRLAATASVCPTWVQTCMLAWDQAPPSSAEVSAYLEFLEQTRQQGIPLQGVLLYSLARPSHQPEAPHLAALPLSWLQDLAQRIQRLGLPVQVTP